MFSATSRSLALVALISSATAAFNPQAKNNVAVYWGQGPDQKPLLETCKNAAVDIVNIGFVNAFPDNSPGSYPGSNFGNACGDQTYTVNGVSTLLKSNCPRIGSDIIECQKTYGKKIFLSLGGAAPQNYYISNDNSANSFADFVWGAFGPSTSAWTSAGKPRPFGNAVVDGFDFDIESYMSTPPKDASGNTINDYQSRGYATMINRLKNTQFPKDTSKSYYISGAPQCPLPDVHLSGPIANAWFDMLFVQFYNNPACSGRAAVNYAAGDSFLKWTQASSKNPNVKIYFGLPASTKAAASASDYLTQPEVKDLVQRFSTNAKWGGIMLWESTYAQGNVVCGKDYTTWSKDIVTAVTSGKTIDTDISKCTSLPSPIHPGVISTCNQYLKTNPGGAKCAVFAERVGVTLPQLYAWNSVLGPNGENCASKFVGDTYYCVGVNPPPGPTQAGITPYCTKYEKANTGGSCPVFASRVGISTAQLYAWNSVLGSSGQNCATSFWGETWYCVGVSANYVGPSTTVKPTSTGAAPAPGPTQSGIISTCSKYLMANPGGSCPVFASRAGITTAQLYAWNPVLGKNGEQCSTQFWGNTYYCVGVRSSKVKRNAAAEVTGYAPPREYGVDAYAAPSDFASYSELPVSTLAPYESTSEAAAIPSTYLTASHSHASSAASSSVPVITTSPLQDNPAAPTHSSSVLGNSTGPTMITSYVIPAQSPTNAGTGYSSLNHTIQATGTGAPTPANTSVFIHPYTGSGHRAEAGFGLTAIFVGLGFLLL